MSTTVIGRGLDTALRPFLRYRRSLEPGTDGTNQAGERKAGDRVVLEVTQGAHSGAKLDLDNAAYTIGSSTEADIVLRDPGLAKVHVRLRRTGRRVELEALGGELTLGGGKTIPQGVGRRCSLPVEIHAGEAQIRLTRVARVNPSSAFPRTVVFAIGAIGAILALPIALSIASYALLSTDESAQQSAKVTWTAANADRSLTSPHALGVQSTERPDAAAAGEALRAQLTTSGLDTLQVEAGPGHLAVSGSLSPHQDDAWRKVLAWFDRTYGGSVPLEARVSPEKGESPPRLALQAIWYGERPYIITADGGRYYEGAFVGDGWSVKDIGEERILLAKGGVTVTLTYR